MWDDDMHEISDFGDVGTEPEWLRTILTVGHIGGQLKWLNDPPPTCLMWFYLDAAKQLVSFKEM